LLSPTIYRPNLVFKGERVFLRPQPVISQHYFCVFTPRPIQPTHWFFKKFTDERLEKIQKHWEQESREDEKKKIRCKVCGHQITSYKKKIEVNGRHQHVFSNPIGVVSEMGCFSSANGCVNYGTPTLEHTWFQSYSWRYALCSNCHTHLGWFYQSGNDSFYGLILENLEEGV